MFNGFNCLSSNMCSAQSDEFLSMFAIYSFNSVNASMHARTQKQTCGHACLHMHS